MTGRILCLGDSLTYGFGLPRGLVWTALCAAQTGAELLGRGVNGNTTGGMLAVLPDLLVREHPDAVLLMGGTNDIAYGGIPGGGQGWSWGHGPPDHRQRGLADRDPPGLRGPFGGSGRS